jgi:hypothetical protein
LPVGIEVGVENAVTHFEECAEADDLAFGVGGEFEEFFAICCS